MASLRSTLSVPLLLCAVPTQAQLLRIYCPEIDRTDLAGSWPIQCIPTPNAFTPGGPPASPGGLLLLEVLYDPTGHGRRPGVGGALQQLGSEYRSRGGTSYTSSQVQLEGTIAAGVTFVVGGPTSSGDISNPVYDQVFDFDPDFQNSGSRGDGVALFDLPACQVTGSTVPVDAVVYGPNNDNGLIDETGVANSPEVGDASSGQSIDRIDLVGSWQIQASPTPISTTLEFAKGVCSSVTRSGSCAF